MTDVRTIAPVTADDLATDSPLAIFRAYYDSLACGDLPAYDQFDVIEVPRLCVPWLFVIQAEERPPTSSYRYRLIGTRNQELVGLNATGMRLKDASGDDYGDRLATSLDNTVRAGRPTLWTTAVLSAGGRPIACHRGIFPFRDPAVPSAGTGGVPRISHLIGLLIPVDRLQWL